MKFRCLKAEYDKKRFLSKKIEKIKLSGITEGNVYFGQIVPEIIYGGSTSTNADEWDNVLIYNDDDEWDSYSLEFFEPVD